MAPRISGQVSTVDREALDLYRMKLALHFVARQTTFTTSAIYGVFGRTEEQREPVYQTVHYGIMRGLIEELGITQTVWLSWANAASARHALQTDSDYELLARVQHMRTRTEEERMSRRARARRPAEPDEDEPVEVEMDMHGNRYARQRSRRYTGVGDLSALEARVQAITGITQRQALTEVEEEYLRSVMELMTPQGAKDALATEPDFSKRRLRVKKK